MLRDVALGKQGRFRRVETRGKQQGRQRERGIAQRRRFDGNGDRMQVNDAVETVMFGLPRDPVPDRAEVVADVFVARRLDAREDACHG